MRGVVVGTSGVESRPFVTEECAARDSRLLRRALETDDTTASDAIIVVAVQRTVAGKMTLRYINARQPRGTDGASAGVLTM